MGILLYNKRRASLFLRVGILLGDYSTILPARESDFMYQVVFSVFDSHVYLDLQGN